MDQSLPTAHRAPAKADSLSLRRIEVKHFAWQWAALILRQRRHYYRECSSVLFDGFGSPPFVNSWRALRFKSFYRKDRKEGAQVRKEMGRDYALAACAASTAPICRATGNRSTKTAPPSGRLWQEMWPLWSCTTP